MKPKESLYYKDRLAKADQDLQRVENLLKDEDLADAGFHLQQALEKYLKGYLLFNHWKLRRIHDLEELLDETVKYNESLEIPSELTRDDIETSLKDAKKLIKALTTEIESKQEKEEEEENER